MRAYDDTPHPEEPEPEPRDELELGLETHTFETEDGRNERRLRELAEILIPAGRLPN
jgi:hypothetical protein